MFFILSKIVWVCLAPANALVFLVALGALMLLRGRAKPARALIGLGTVGLLAIGFLPIGVLILRPLEDRFPPPPGDMPAPAGVIVLGGSTDESISAARGQPTIADAATRVTAAVELARRYPDARLVFSGGSGRLFPGARTEAEDTRALWVAMGVAPERITLEDRSRNTDENARFTAALVHPGAGERWLLVTSAYHMPRAVGLFRAANVPVTPYPVDYQTTGTTEDVLPPRNVTTGLSRFDLAMREWVGLAVYRLTGRIRDLFPGPLPTRAAAP